MVRPEGLCFGRDTDFALSGVVGKLYDAPLYLYGMGDSALARFSRSELPGRRFFIVQQRNLYLVLQREDFEKLAYARRRVSLQFSLSA